MDTPKPLQKPVHLLDDLESIRQLLGDDNLQPPLLTDTVDDGEQEQIPMLFEAVDNESPSVEPQSTPAPAPAPAAQPAAPVDKGPDALLHLDSELRAAAQLIMQDVIDDFAPHIETEIKRRLEARMERLLGQYE
ncbi:DNA polymerase III subunit chi [Pseudomonas sp. B2M1-30]|uniref:DNA polymerase III subunit chi n=1 Tax=Pseudomonas koreensis TaxID=198620 RepID=A0A9X2XFM7_9PSED|nr:MULTISPECIES: DNA polymerase III subunit chi [Pseudomonas]MBV4475867.1 DNA polymerase III subunit chi [Pseudomonas botevensis]MCU0119361.1 DNA polymerase III subunit chi [Pseudomonas sp. B2M1-30]MCU7247634.1 DNA polymerase III subunit chi [Pseudomonas koreensis]MCU7262175.1 DNA polymerase III subunit chi [Pseudomonas koreensis]